MTRFYFALAGCAYAIGRAFYSLGNRLYGKAIPPLGPEELDDFAAVLQAEGEEVLRDLILERDSEITV